MPALAYKDVLQRYDRARAFGETRSLPEYAQHLNDIYQTQDFSEGLRDGPWTRFSTRADEFLGGTVGQVTGPVGGAVGSLFGQEEAGRTVGEGLPRALLQTLPAYFAGPEAGLPATAAALGLMGGVFGGETYANTGSAKAALISGGTAAALPGVGRYVGELGARAFGAPLYRGLVSEGGEVVGLGAQGTPFRGLLNVTSGQRAAQFGASQLAQSALQEGSGYAQQKTLNPDAPYDWLSPSFLIGQIPFTVMDTVHMAKAPTLSHEDAQGLVTPVKRVPKAPVEPFTPREATEDENATTASALDAYGAIANDPSISPEERDAKLGVLLASVNTPKVVQGAKEVQRATNPLDTEITLQGKAEKQTNGNWKVRVDSTDAPEGLIQLPEHKTVFVNGVEPEVDQVTGVATFKAKVGQVDPRVKYGIGEESLDPNANPELPQRSEADLLSERVAQNPNEPYRQPTEQVLGNIEGSVHDTGTPVGDVFEGVHRLSPSEHAALQSVGVDAMGAKPEVQASLRPVAHAVESAQTSLESAVAKGTVVPKSAEEYLPLVDQEKAKVVVPKELAKGATSTEAAETTRLLTQTPEVDAAMKQRVVLAEQGKTLMKARKKGEKVSPEVLQQQAQDTAARVEKAQREYDNLYANPVDAQGPTRVTWKDNLKFAEKELKDAKAASEDVVNLIAKSGTEKVRAEDVSGKEQHRYGQALKDENGQRLSFATEAEASAHMAEVEDNENLRVRDAGQDRGDKRWYIAPIENLKASFETPRSEEGSTLENVLSSETTGRTRDIGPTVESDATNLPDVSQRNLMDMLDHLSKTPDYFGELIDKDVPETILALQRAKVFFGLAKGSQLGIDEVNKALRAEGIQPYRTPLEMRSETLSVIKGARQAERLPTVQNLASSVPSDPEVVAQMNLGEGAMGLVKWIEGLKIPMVSGLISSYKNFPNELARVGIVHEGPDWRPGLTFYQRNEATPYINIEALPTKERETEVALAMAHELTHHMTDEMASRTDPAAVKFRQDSEDVLEALRKSKQLPLKVKNLLQRALRENHYRKYATGEIENIETHWRNIIGDKLVDQYSDVLYGLLNVDEMLAQMFSSHQFMAFMHSTEVPKEQGTSGLNWFGKVWSGLMERVMPDRSASATAFEHMLRSYDNYLTGGLLKNTYNGKDFIRDTLIHEKGARPEALTSRMHTVDRTFVKGDLYSSIYGFQREGEAGTLPATAHVGPIDQPLRTALVSGLPADVFKGTMALLPDQVPVYQDLFYRMQQDVAIAKDLYQQVKDGRVRAEIPEGSEERLRQAEVKLNAMRKALRKQGMAMEGQANLRNFTYEGLSQATGVDRLQNTPAPMPMSAPPEMEQAQGLMGLSPAQPKPTLSRLDATGKVKKTTSEAELEGKTESTPIERAFQMAQFFAQVHPAVKEGVSNLFSQQGAMKETSAKLGIARFTNPETGQLDEKGLGDVLRRVVKDPKRKSAYNSIFSLIAEKEKAGATWDMDDPEFKQLLSKLDPMQKKDVLTQFRQDTLQHKYFVNTVMREKFGELNHLNTSQVIAALDGMMPEQAKVASDKLYEALGMLRDPAQAQVGQQMLGEVAKGMTGPTFIAALRHANSSLVDFQNFLDVAKKNYSWISEQRYDAHHLRMVGPQGQDYYTSAPTKGELMQRRDEKLAQGYKFLYYTPKTDANAAAGGVNEAVFSKLQEMDTLAVNRLTEALSGRPDSAELLQRVLPEVNRADQVQASMKAFTPLPMTRKLVEGRENIDLLQNREEFYKRAGNWFNNKLTRANADLDGLHPELAGNRVLKQWFDQMVTNYLTPDNPLVTKFNELVFYQRMGLNFGNMALEAIQSLGTGMQSLISETGSVRDAYGMTAWANKELLQHARTGKWSDPAIAWFAHAAEQRGDFAPVLYNDIHDPDANDLMSISGKIGGPMKEGVGVMKTGVRWLGSFFQKYNNKIAMLAAFKIAQERGLGTTIPELEEAYRFARDVKNRGTFTGGKAQRSVGLWGIKTRAVPQLMSSLQTYTVGWFSQMAKDYKIGFGGAGDASLAQRNASKKAFIYGLTAQAVLAGGLGLPGVGQGIALLNQATGLDLKGWLRQHLSGLFDEDQDSGGLLTNLALRGAANAFSPIDPSNRAAISVPFVGLDPYKGFSVSALAGAPATSVSDLVQGLLASARMDPMGMQKLLPSALKGPAQLAEGDGDVRDSRGGLLQTLSPAERWMVALGLPPSRIQNSRDAADALKKGEAQTVATKEALVDGLARLARQGNTQEVQRQMLQLKQADPTLDLQSLGRSIAQRVVAQTIPYSSRHNVNLAVDMTGLGSSLPGTEMLQRQTGYQVQSALGLHPAFDPMADHQAQQRDQMIDSGSSRSEVFRATQGRKRAAHPFVPTWPGASQ